MKKFYYFPMAALVLFLNGCNDVDEELQVLTSSEVITASVPTIESRTTAEGLDILWSAGDQIGVFKTQNSYTTDSYEHNCFTLVSGGEGKTTASFAATTSSGETNTLAYYPYMDGSSYDGATLFMSIPASQSYADGCQMIMAGTFVEGSSSVSFKNAMALAVITVNNIPTGYTKAVLTADASEKLNGAANVTFTSEGQAELKLSSDNTAGTNTLTVEFGDNTDVNKTFYFAIPVDEYTSGLKMTLEGTNVTSKEIGTLTDANDVSKFTANANEFHTYTRTIDDVVSNATSVESADDLKNALAAGGNIKLTAAITLSTALTVNKDVTIDLNGQTLTATGTAFEVTSGKLTIEGNGKLTSGVDAISIKGSEDANVEVTIGENVEIEATDCCIVVPNSNNSENITIITAGKLSATGNYNTVQFNGNAKGVTLNVTGGTISHTAANAVGIYFPCDGTLNISGGEISAATAVYVKSGNLNITGGTLKGNGNAADYSFNGNGCNPTGDALVIDNCAYPSNISSISVSGGSFVSTNGKAVGSYAGNGVTEVKTGFITGGTFSDASAFEHLGDNANVTLGADMELTKAITITKTATINLNDFSITAPACDAFEVQTGGLLTINGGADSEVYAGTGGDNVTVGSVCAVFANGGNVVINGGYYKVAPDSNSERNDCIYAKQSSQITINGGKFEYTGESSDENGKDGDMFLLNCFDESSAKITVNGGTFKNHVPSYESVAPSGYTEVVLGEGKAVYNGEKSVTVAHTGDSDVWYTVK